MGFVKYTTLTLPYPYPLPSPLTPYFSARGHLLVIIDDHLHAPIYHSLADLYAIKSRSKTISVLLLTQNLFTHAQNAGRYNKEILMNSTLTILFCNRRDSSISRRIGQTIFSGRFQFFMSVYKSAVCEDNSQHKYLAIFTDPSTSRKCELRSNIFFEEETTILFWPRKWKA